MSGAISSENGRRCVGLQRGTFRLSLPYKYSIPLTTASVMMSWLVSQSIFVIATKGYAHAGTNSTTQFVARPELDAAVVGFSLIGVVLSLIVGSVVVVSVVALGFLRYEGRVTGEAGAPQQEPVHKKQRQHMYMPLAGTWSAAISAGCHPPPDDNDAQWFPLMWGWVPETGQWCFSTARTIRHLQASETQEKNASTWLRLISIVLSSLLRCLPGYGREDT
jgi:hypothetical protein